MFVTKFNEFKEQTIELPIKVIDFVNRISDDGEHVVNFIVLGKDKGFNLDGDDVYSSNIILHLNDILRTIRDSNESFDMDCLFDEIKLNLTNQPESIVARARQEILRKHLAKYTITIKFTPCIAGEYIKQNGESATREHNYISTTIETIKKA